MRVLLDESVPKALGFAIEGYFVRSAQTAGFAGLLNGELVETALKFAPGIRKVLDELKPAQLIKLYLD